MKKYAAFKPERAMGDGMISKDDFETSEWQRQIDSDLYTCCVSWRSEIFEDAFFCKTIYMMPDSYKDKAFLERCIRDGQDDLMYYIERMKDAMLDAFDIGKERNES